MELWNSSEHGHYALTDLELWNRSKHGHYALTVLEPWNRSEHGHYSTFKLAAHAGAGNEADHLETSQIFMKKKYKTHKTQDLLIRVLFCSSAYSQCMFAAHVHSACSCESSPASVKGQVEQNVKSSDSCDLERVKQETSFLQRFTANPKASRLSFSENNRDLLYRCSIPK